MTTATGDPSNTLERLDCRSARARRADQQRATVEAFAREQRRKRLLLAGLGVAGVLLALTVGVFVLLPRPTAAQGHQVPIEGNRQHVAQGASRLGALRLGAAGSWRPPRSAGPRQG